jgi:hypothetical protein
MVDWDKMMITVTHMEYATCFLAARASLAFNLSERAAQEDIISRNS